MKATLDRIAGGSSFRDREDEDRTRSGARVAVLRSSRASTTLLEAQLENDLGSDDEGTPLGIP
jgi:hypothetical protein